MAVFKSFYRIQALILIYAFVATSINVPSAQAGEMVVPIMPKPGTMVDLSPAFTPSLLKGIVIHPDNALKFDFIVHKGDGNLTDAQKKIEYNKLIKYFLASLAVPDKDQWVNLSPYEKNRIIEDDFGKTEMGRDLLAQDYLLKQITSSLIYPEKGLGKKFWEEVYAKAYKEYGNTNIPVNTFNKVWIVPDKATIYEKRDTAYVLENHLKVMLEEDYLALNKNAPGARPAKRTSSLDTQVIREIILPAIEKEVNEGRNFALLRQVYSGMLLAAWYKRALKESLLGKIYADKAKTKGINQDPKNNEEIYEQYVQAYKKGVFNFIKEEPDSVTQQMIPRKYFSGGTMPYQYDHAVTVKKELSGRDAVMLSAGINGSDLASIALEEAIDAAMTRDTETKDFDVEEIEALSKYGYEIISAPFDEDDVDKMFAGILEKAKKQKDEMAVKTIIKWIKKWDQGKIGTMHGNLVQDNVTGKIGIIVGAADTGKTTISYFLSTNNFKILADDEINLFIRPDGRLNVLGQLVDSPQKDSVVQKGYGREFPVYGKKAYSQPDFLIFLNDMSWQHAPMEYIKQWSLTIKPSAKAQSSKYLKALDALPRKAFDNNSLPNEKTDLSKFEGEAVEIAEWVRKDLGKDSDAAMNALKPEGDKIFSFLKTSIESVLNHKGEVPNAVPEGKLSFLTRTERGRLNALLEILSRYNDTANQESFLELQRAAVVFDQDLRLYGYAVNFFREGTYNLEGIGLTGLGTMRALYPVLGPIAKINNHVSGSGQQFDIEHVDNVIERSNMGDIFLDEVEGVVIRGVTTNPTVYRLKGITRRIQAQASLAQDMMKRGAKVNPLDQLHLLGISSINYQDSKELTDVYAEVVDAHEGQHYRNMLDRILMPPSSNGPLNQYTRYFSDETAEFLSQYYANRGPKTAADQRVFEYKVSEEITAFLAELGLGPLPIFSLKDLIERVRTLDVHQINSEHRVAALEIVNSFLHYMYKLTNDIRFDVNILDVSNEEFDEIVDFIRAHFEKGIITERNLAAFAEDEFSKRFLSSLYAGDYQHLKGTTAVRAAGRYVSSVLGQLLLEISALTPRADLIGRINNLTSSLKSLERRSLIAYVPVSTKRVLHTGDIVEIEDGKFIVEKQNEQGQVTMLKIPSNRIISAGENFYVAVNRSDLLGAKVFSLRGDEAMTAKKVSEIQPIWKNSYTMIRSRAELNEYIEEPWLEAVRIFYDKNIQTISSTANMGNVGHEGALTLDYDSLSEKNKQQAEKLGPVISNQRGRRLVTILLPITKDTTVEEFSRKAVKIANDFEKQKLTWARTTTWEEMRQTWGELATVENLEGMYYYDPESRLFYDSEEIFRRAKESGVDHAVTAAPGGIDFNSANLYLQIQRDGKGVPLPLSQQDMAKLSRIEGFVPRIIEIRPAPVPLFSELKQRLQPQPAALASAS